MSWVFLQAFIRPIQWKVGSQTTIRAGLENKACRTEFATSVGSYEALRQEKWRTLELKLVTALLSMNSKPNTAKRATCREKSPKMLDHARIMVDNTSQLCPGILDCDQSHANLLSTGLFGLGDSVGHNKFYLWHYSYSGHWWLGGGAHQAAWLSSGSSVPWRDREKHLPRSRHKT